MSDLADIIVPVIVLVPGCLLAGAALARLLGLAPSAPELRASYPPLPPRTPPGVSAHGQAPPWAWTTGPAPSASVEPVQRVERVERVRVVEHQHHHVHEVIVRPAPSTGTGTGTEAVPLRAIEGGRRRAHGEGGVR